MKRLTYKTLEESGYNGFVLKDAPERVLQFGEGNFLRAFVDYFFDVLNETEGFDGKIAMVQPRAGGRAADINEQEGLYTVYLRGYENGEKIVKKRVITSVSRCIDPYIDFDAFMECAKNPELKYITSNTTEAGIAFSDADKLTDRPAKGFPAKLTQFLYERFKVFGGKSGTGFVVLSCELIDNNGKELLNCVEKYIKLWNLPDEFLEWVREENIFCSTLVDRIVTGYPKSEAEKFNSENGYDDALIAVGELFGFWAIEGSKKLCEMIPFEKTGLPVLITDDISAYKRRKVRMLNGTHTTLAASAMLAGKGNVRECMDDEVICEFVKRFINDEIMLILPLAESELMEFADAVIDRFRNPYIDHRLADISLNSVAKWRARVLPSLLEYKEKFGVLPPLLSFSLAALIRFYRCAQRDGVFYGKGEMFEYQVRDDNGICEYFAGLSWEKPYQAVVSMIFANTDLWGQDLNDIEGLTDKVTEYIEKIDEVGIRELMRSLI